jgi:hypothetical protein
MPHSEAYDRFLRSKQIGYDQWHDGTGYDLDAFAAMTPHERDEEARRAREAVSPDWRDLELLGAHGGEQSIKHLRDLLTHPSIDTRAHALDVLIDRGHTPGAVPDVQLSHIINAIDNDDDEGLTMVLLLAQDHAGPRAKLALVRGMIDKPALSLHFAATLLDLAGLSDDTAAFDPKFRPTLLRLLPDNAEADRVAAIQEIARLLKIDISALPEAGSGKDIAWADETWPRQW